MKNKTHNKAFLTAAIAAVGMIGAPSAMATIVLFDDFDGGGLGTGDGTSINGGFQLVGNSGNGTGTVGESGGNATITNAANNFNNSGIVSISSFNASTATSISATWVISSQTAVGTAAFNASELLLQGGIGFRDTAYIQFVIGSDGQWKLNANDGSGAVELFDGSALGDIPNGYSVTMDLNAAGWSVSGSGFNANPAESAAWSGGFDFTALQTNLYAAAMIQVGNNNSGTTFMNVDSISVDVVPEPTSAALLGIAGFAFILRRRK